MSSPVSSLAPILAAALFCAAPVFAEDKPIPGHSMNGEAFNEGPRQAAVLIPGTGDVSFPVTTKSELAQKFFTQGVGQLHGFWYFEAERSFRQVAALDPDCAMAYWGMAMANINTPKRAAQFVKVAVQKKGATPREQLWISAYGDYFGDGPKSDRSEDEKRKGLVHDLEELIYQFPDDLEAKAFLVFQLWDNNQHNLPLPSRLAVDALARQVLAVNPMHPIHHYLIHLWNSREGDKHALADAAVCGQSAPGIAHMWHMSGHTYSQLKRYGDAAWQQEASARVDHAYMASARIMPEQIHNYAHNNNWLVEDLEYVGRVHDAADLAMNMIELPRMAPNRSQAYNMGRERLLDVFTRYEMWGNLTALADTMYLAPSDNTDFETKRLASMGVAWLSQGRMEQGNKILAALEAKLKKTREARTAAADAAEQKGKTEKKSDDQIAKAMADALRSYAYHINANEAAIAEVKIYQALAENRKDAVKPLLAAAKEIPSERKARIELALGDNAEAVRLAREASNADPAKLQPLANLVGVLWAAGQKDEAKEVFGKLRAAASAADLDAPVFQRLAPAAAEWGLPVDWRLPAAPEPANRPDVKSLGPFRWHPYLAPAWNLAAKDGSMHSLADFAGKPTLVVFYLGSGCSRCIEQLNIFEPLTQKYADAGIQIVAVSTDSPEALQKTFAQAHNPNGFPFPVYGDANLEAFKAYRAFDDFEHIPLHGTFLIDGAGYVRWQDISYQPFREGEWLLTEAKRLLSVPVTESRTADAK